MLLSDTLFLHKCFSMCVSFYFFFLMIRRPPRSTRTDTLFPYTTLFRSIFDAAALAFDEGVADAARAGHAKGVADRDRAAVDVEQLVRDAELIAAIEHLHREGFVEFPEADIVHLEFEAFEQLRSEERRVGQECVSTCRSRWSPSP